MRKGRKRVDMERDKEKEIGEGGEKGSGWKKGIREREMTSERIREMSIR